MKTLTVKIADIGTPYGPFGDPPEIKPSAAGHMWFSIDSDGPNGSAAAQSLGFASVNHKAVDVGQVFRNDDQLYTNTYYTGTIVINDTQGRKAQ